MSYYILPKNIHNINVNPQYSNELCRPSISYSLLNYYHEVKIQIDEMFVDDCDLSDNSFEDAIKIINPYEFIFSKVPGSKFSVSKLKPKNNIFYDLLEIYNNLNIFESFKYDNVINVLHVSPNYVDAIECFEMFREGLSDMHYSSNKIDIDNDLNGIKMDFIFYESETESSNYFVSLIQAIIVILRNQKKNGTSVIKIGSVFHKPVIDILYYLSSLYDKVYISKPNTNNIISFDRYIVCKSFIYDEQSIHYLKLNYLKLLIFIKKLENKHVYSVLDFDVPYFFKNKIDDLNIIIGQQQLEALDQIITIYKNKNKNDKIELIKKNNIQKSVSWCEKYKIPCNKFAEKINIFLPIVNVNEILTLN
jgi:hypothetical protein